MDTQQQISEILLKEYAEAGQICRQHETLTRISISIFVPFFTALIGYLQTQKSPPAANLLLALIGLSVALLLLNIVLRLQGYYRSYIKRAKEIESLIVVEGVQVMNLYTQGEKAVPCATISNKTAIALILSLVAIYFFGAAIIYGYQIACRA